MAEYIKRETVLAHLRECEGTPPEIAYTYPIFKAIECFVEGLSAADVAPVVRGEWKWNAERTKPFCSECGEVPWRENNRNLPNFCPNCGADMRVDEGEKLESHSKEDGE